MIAQVEMVKVNDENKRLRAELARLDDVPEIMEEGGVSNADRAVRVIRKQATEKAGREHE